MSYALVAPTPLGEEAKRLVRSLGIGRSDLKIGRRDAHLLIPIARPFEPSHPEMRVEVIEFLGARPPRSYKDVIQVPERVRPQLPTSFDVVGDLVLLKVPPDLRVFGPAIGEAILKVHKNVKGVFRDDGVAGPFRLRSLTPLSGETRTATAHMEYGAKFFVDVSKAYFSPRLANEHDRIARLVQPGEFVVDATSGVGPFAVLIARTQRACTVLAIDLNPDAVALLSSNVRENRVGDRVTVRQGDALQVLGDVEPPHRVIVNLPHGGADLLSVAARRVRPGGTLHYYRIVPEAEGRTLASQGAQELASAAGRPVSVLDVRTVHAYSPQDRLVAVDFRVE